MMAVEFTDYDQLENEGYRTFVMSVPDPNMPKRDRDNFGITVRPSKSSYEDFLKQNYTVMLGPVVMQFDEDIGFAEAVIKAALRGINIDFIEIDRLEYNSRFYVEKCVVIKMIDLHKDDVLTEEQRAKFPRFYVVKNKDDSNTLKSFVIDRYQFEPGSRTDFTKGEYEDSGIIAGFARFSDAADWCEELNLKNRS